MTNAKETTRTYSAKIAYASKELSLAEKIKFKDTRDAISLNKISEESPVIVPVVGYVVLDVHNEKSEDKDYRQYLLIGADGAKYMTGSESFFNSFVDIWEELTDDNEVPENGWDFKVYQLPSKNFQGRNFVSCSLA